LLTAQEITLRYDRDSPAVLRQFTLTVYPGEMVGVLGPNGSGKSTLVRALSRTLRPAEGAVVLADADLYTAVSARAAARQIGTVPQNAPVAFDFTVREVVEMGRAPHVGTGLFAGPSAADARIVDEAMRSVGVSELAARTASSLSGGELQRVLLARALAQEPSVILLDEPTASLDIRHQSEVLGLVRRLAREGKAVLAVLHDLNLTASYCDRVVLLNKGAIVAQGTPAEVLTAEHIAEVYGARVWVRCHPTSGRPLVLALPEALNAVTRVDHGESLTVHIIGGGGAGAGLMAALIGQGYAVTAGAINTGDTDQEAAEMLGITFVREAPFTALSDESVRRATELAAAADVLVVADTPFGPGNVANLRIALAQRREGKRVVCVQPADADFAARDFTGGEAGRIWDELRGAGAQVVVDLGAVLIDLHRIVAVS
jgi:iron complex transport system ATP-binding protein